AIGLEDTVVVQTKDAILVCAKDKVQDVKQMVELLKEKGRVDLL
ncbi:MAG: mannose-1-phosphate guanylyltransferase, partial [Gammaproteobacteria bacterium]|nr:mannose-1-phosphate guanylyltransferase [Gammaproteobacteria bacterium]